jgi:hypothetical protein
MSEEVFAGIDENKDGFLSTSGKYKMINSNFLCRKL